jgi:hypothetical protein
MQLTDLGHQWAGIRRLRMKPDLGRAVTSSATALLGLLVLCSSAMVDSLTSELCVSALWLFLVFDSASCAVDVTPRARS